MQRSNLPLLKAYVVTIHDGLDYITVTTGPNGLAPGCPIAMLAGGATNSDAAGTLTTPRG